MSLASSAAPTTAAIPWFKAPFLGYHRWARAAQRVWEWLLRPSHGGRRQFKIRDWELARALGVGRRCIQFALYYLEHVAGVIRRWRTYGPDGGRVVEVVIALAGPGEKAGGKPAENPGPGSAERKRAPVPNVPPIQDATPEQLAAAAAAVEAAQAGAGLPEPTAEETAAAESWFRGFLDRSRAHTAKRAASRTPGLKRSPEELRGQLDSLRARRSAAGDPPPDPPPDPGG